MGRKKKEVTRLKKHLELLESAPRLGICEGASFVFEVAVTARLDARRMLSNGGTTSMLFTRFQVLLAKAQKASSAKERKILLAEARGISQVIREELNKKEAEVA
jgi:hypothetical protein